MIVDLRVRVEITDDNPDEATPYTSDDYAEACRTAIENAIESAFQNGFTHPLAYETSIVPLNVTAIDVEV